MTQRPPTTPIARVHPRSGALWSTLVAALLTTPLAYGQGLNYVDADNDEFGLGTDNLEPNSAFGASTTSGATSSTDQLWGLRGSIGSDGTLYETRTNEVVPEITMALGTAHGLTANTSYDIYIVHWAGNSENQTIAGGLTPGEQIIYNRAGPNGTFPTATASTRASSGFWQTPPPATVSSGNPVFTEGNRSMLLGKIGTTSSDPSGNLSVYINDPGGAGDGSRTWFDGVAYVPAGTPVFVTASIDRGTGNLTVTNPTAGVFQVKSLAVASAAGGLNATTWTSISATADGDSGATFDSDIWSITQPADPANTPFTTQLAESENAGAITVGGELGSGDSINLGNVWQKSIFEDVTVSLTLADDTVFTITPEYTGAEIVRGDFNGDGALDIANDFATLMSNLHGTFPVGTVGAQQYRGGDLTSNGVVNFNDFAAFRETYDEVHGVGAFAAAVGAVPEPSTVALTGMALAALGLASRRRRRSVAPVAGVASDASALRARSTRALSTGMLSALAATVISASALAAPVTGWQVDPLLEPTDPAPIAGAATASPTLGDGSPESASNSAMFASFPAITLADGEQITLTGSMTLVGTTPSQNNLRWGLFKDDGVAPDTGGWRGYISEASSRDIGGTMLVRDPTGTDFANQTFMSTTNGRSAVLAAAASSGADLLDGTYQFTMVAARFGNEMELRGSFVGGTDFKDVYRSATDTDPTRIPPGFQFDRTGFLSGGAIAADQLAFNNIDVAKSDVSSLTLRVTTSGPQAGQMEIVNNEAGASFDMSYYQITSELGALNLGGWNSLDDQESGDAVGVGWDEAGGSSGLLISEGNLLGSRTLAPAGVANLGNAFDSAAAQDLRFHYGLPDGTLLRGFVEYVSGPTTLPGDFNGDLVVDGDDLAKWRGDFGANNSGSDADNDGDSDGNDFLVWQRNLGSTAAAPAAGAVPEPSTAMMLLGGSMAWLAAVRRRRDR